MGKVLRLPRMFGGRKVDEDHLPEYAGFDAELECMMACVEELARLEGRKGKAARNRAVEYLIKRFDGEDQDAMEAAQVVQNTGGTS